MTWVYCEPKSRVRIFECFGGAEVFTFAMDESAVRRVRRLDRRALVVRGRLVPDQKRRARAEIPLLGRFVVRGDRRNRPRASRTRLRAGSTRASSAHFRNELIKSKWTGLTGFYKAKEQRPDSGKSCPSGKSCLAFCFR